MARWKPSTLHSSLNLIKAPGSEEFYFTFSSDRSSVRVLVADGWIWLSGFFFPKINLGEPKINKNERNSVGNKNKNKEPNSTVRNDKTFMIDRGGGGGGARASTRRWTEQIVKGPDAQGLNVHKANEGSRVRIQW